MINAWVKLRQTNPELGSPYFTPKFTGVIASIRSGVEVAVVEQAGEIVALFPYQRQKFNIACPVGEILSDYQGMICAPGFAMDPRQLLSDCGLAAWDFNHLLTAQTMFLEFHQLKARSLIMDFSSGYENYVKEHKEAGGELIKQCGKFARRLEREVGPLRFVAHSPDIADLERLIAWKSAHLRARRMSDPFAFAWVRQVLSRIHATQTAGFAGLLSVLYAGDHVVASHFGMRSETTWHGWFLVYDQAYAKCSPGLLLLLKMAEHAPALGLQAFDLGRGEQPYKHRLMNGEVQLAEGSVEIPCFTTAARQFVMPVIKTPFRLRCWVSKSPLGPFARRVRDGIQGIS